MTKEEKAEWDLWMSRKAEFEEELAESQQMLAAETDARKRQVLTDDIAQTRKVLDILNRALGTTAD